LAYRGIIPKVFCHDLKGNDSGSILILGEILEPSIVYSPLASSQYVYINDFAEVASIVFHCVHPEVTQRPSMGEVAGNPQDVTSNIDMHIVFFWWRAQFYFCKIKPRQNQYGKN
jgi:hypothetical protein